MSAKNELVTRILRSLGGLAVKGAVAGTTEYLHNQLTGEVRFVQHIARRMYEARYPGARWESLSREQKQEYGRMALAALDAVRKMVMNR